MTVRALGPWFGLAGGPTAWAVALMANYLLVPDACGRDSTVFLHVSRGVLLAVALAALAAAAVGWRSPRPPGGRSGRRAAFLGVVGMLLAGISAFAIVIEGQANLLIDPCAV